MRYTLWSHDTLLGTTELAHSAPGLRLGTLEPTPAAIAMMPELTRGQLAYARLMSVMMPKTLPARPAVHDDADAPLPADRETAEADFHEALQRQEEMGLLVRDEQGRVVGSGAQIGVRDALQALQLFGPHRSDPVTPRPWTPDGQADGDDRPVWDDEDMPYMDEAELTEHLGSARYWMHVEWRGHCATCSCDDGPLTAGEAAQASG